MEGFVVAMGDGSELGTMNSMIVRIISRGRDG